MQDAIYNSKKLLKYFYWEQASRDQQMDWVLIYEIDKAQNERNYLFNRLKRLIPERINSEGNTKNLHWFDWARTGEDVFYTITKYRELEQARFFQ